MQLNHSDLFRQQAYIGGQWLDANDKSVVEITNPATGEVIGCVPQMGEAETLSAITHAHHAWDAWKKQSAKSRAVILRKWYELIMANQDDLATLLTCEQGKPFDEAKGEVAYGASYIEWFAEETKRIYGDVIPGHLPDKRVVVIKQGIGVVGAITPWNFPNAMITRKAAPAMGAGCPFIVKPAPDTPFSALALAVLAEEAGIPAGIFSVITGDAKAIGGVLTGHEKVRKISFTGSTAVGKQLMRQCADSVKKVSLELGGNAPFIVFDDADVDAAVAGAIISKFRNAGQTCVCANRIYVQAGIHDAFVEKFAQKIQSLNVGNGLDSGVQIGPLINQAAVDKVKQHLDDALDKGAKLVTGGTVNELGGTFLTPTLLTQVNASMQVAQEETFGPLAPIFQFTSEAEVIEMANDTPFGLAAYFYARDLGRVWRVAEAIEAGMVGVNTGLISTEVAPFGGIKESGIGREGSKYGMDDFVEIKYICMDIN
ncbi:NAD-dependent succinate-semialdehyde dehydrogenase [Ostreibacterium oceani]|uniref:Succinate-semialdehyde dehydrogenase n=1 Tax=Ostreibacterium oceani TaxID=2654998 RepID=A0A6N7EUW8_9GAMM|nr:NAD-dependent succinate-semialdehyde dehydrogenase [Ostreibacterium oceani]MPV85320.1 succinate-semialdehyde dehydrogenase [Ostreibacterium oceani]